MRTPSPSHLGLSLSLSLLLAGGCRGTSAADGSAQGSSGGNDSEGSSDLPTPAECRDNGPAVGSWYLRRLTGEQLDNTVRDLLGTNMRPSLSLPPDEVVGAFYSNVTAPVTDSMVESYMDVAEELALEAVGALATLLPCDPDIVGEQTCAGQFVDDFGPRAYRRPLSAAERDGLLGVFDVGRAQADFAAGIRLVITAALQSPYFLYHAEFGSGDGQQGVVELDDYELASRLSYFFWNTMPDAELFSAANNGQFRGSEDALLSQAERMLDDPRAAAAIESFHLQWLGIAELDLLEKDASVFPDFTPELGAALQRETGTFADYIIRFNDGKLSTLLTAPFSFPSGGGFDIYGIERPPDYDGTAPVALDPAQRAGILTHPSVLAMHAQADQTSPIRRGVLVRENILCQMLDEPPPNVNNVPPEPDPGSTTRERFEQHRTDPSCSVCHALIDPLGFGFEYYDGIGVFRTTENGMSIDGSGELSAVRDISGEFDGATELAFMLADSDEVRTCVTKQWFRFAFGRIEAAQDACSVATLDSAFAASDYNIRELLLTLATTQAFRYRPVASGPDQ